MSRLAWVDVFAAGPMTGNPLAVVLDPGAWSSARMQALAAELGISETVVVVPPQEGGEHRLRIFTPRRELPMAGHPVVGAAWVLRRHPSLGGAAAAGALSGLAVGARASTALLVAGLALAEAFDAAPPPRRGAEGRAGAEVDPRVRAGVLLAVGGAVGAALMVAPFRAAGSTLGFAICSRFFA